MPRELFGWIETPIETPVGSPLGFAPATTPHPSTATRVVLTNRASTCGVHRIRCKCSASAQLPHLRRGAGPSAQPSGYLSAFFVTRLGTVMKLPLERIAASQRGTKNRGVGDLARSSDEKSDAIRICCEILNREGISFLPHFLLKK